MPAFGRHLVSVNQVEGAFQMIKLFNHIFVSRSSVKSEAPKSSAIMGQDVIVGDTLMFTFGAVEIQHMKMADGYYVAFDENDLTVNIYPELMYYRKD